ncbi:MAG: N-acetylmuramoyl-L-alanine amidase [Salinivirgaceae bacterium]|jgi:N-acetylmuramoyl-L-alanine amidase|nr:N-acetylmuramoyl-L-alanine amidase [Salinivirgaceae bacterium]
MHPINKISTILAIAMLIFSLAAFAVEDDEPKYTVVLDAGHGGKDSGARGSYSMEKDIVLDVSMQVGQYINNYLDNVKVIYTRKTDEFIGLYKRADIANKAESDLFVSIHANASPSKRPYGTETFVMGLHKTEENLEVAQKENAVITLEDDYTEKYEGYDPHSAESYIIFSLMQNTFLDQSLMAAGLTQTEFREKANRKDRGVKQAGFLVLWKTTMPSILIEIGFMSNATEEKYLNSEQGKDYIASAIFRSIREYFEMLDESQVENKVVERTPDDTITNTPDNSIYFTIQLTASTHLADTAEGEFAKLDGEVQAKIIGNYYKYFFGNATNYNDAKALQNMCMELFPDAFIVAFNGDKPISVAQAMEIIQK